MNAFRPQGGTYSLTLSKTRTSCASQIFIRIDIIDVSALVV